MSTTTTGVSVTSDGPTDSWLLSAVAPRWIGDMTVEWSLRCATPDDGPWIAELKAQVLRDDLERLGRWDPVRARRRVLDGFDHRHTWIIRAIGAEVGSIALRPESDAVWIEYFYLQRSAQGIGIGSAVLQHVLDGHADHRPLRLNVLQGSKARELYERHGFVLESQDEVDVFLVRQSDATTSTS